MAALLVVLFGLLQAADGIVTYIGLQSVAIAEANPFASCCFELLGTGVAITLIKLVALIFIIFLFLERRKLNNRWITGTLTSGVLFSSWVLLHNLALILSD